MIRLLNEIGTPLLTSDWARTQFARLTNQKTVTCEGDLASILLAGRGELGDWGSTDLRGYRPWQPKISA